MKIWSVVVGLIVFLLVLTSSWTKGSAAPQPSGPSVRAWALVDFDRETVSSAQQLWNDANYLKSAKDRWGGSGLNAAILSISVVRPIGKLDTRPRKKRTGAPGEWDAFVLIRARDEATLERVERYIEDKYSHVDMFRIDEGN